MRLLGVCGGGLLGVIPAANLLRYEELGKQSYGEQYRLVDSFDAVGGSSTGAMIASAIALGFSAQEIADIYLKDACRGFRRRKYAIPFLHDVMDGDLLESFFAGRTKGRRLCRDQLGCDLTVFVKDITRTVPLAFTTLPFPDGTALSVEIHNDPVDLAKLLRASTAAPGFFSPVRLELENIGPCVLVDGGISFHNNPSLLLTFLAQPSSGNPVDILSLGTGSSRPSYRCETLLGGPAIRRILRAFAGMVREGEVINDHLLDVFSQAEDGPITISRRDMSLDMSVFEELGMSLRKSELRSMRNYMAISGKQQLFEAAYQYALREISEPLPLSRRVLTNRTGAEAA